MSEIYGQANRYGEGIRDMSDFRSGIDDDLNTGEKSGTPTFREISDWCDKYYRDRSSGKQLTEEALGRILYDLEKITDHCDIGGWRLDAIKEAAERIEIELVGKEPPEVIA